MRGEVFLLILIRETVAHELSTGACNDLILCATLSNPCRPGFVAHEWPVRTISACPTTPICAARQGIRLNWPYNVLGTYVIQLLPREKYTRNTVVERVYQAHAQFGTHITYVSHVDSRQRSQVYGLFLWPSWPGYRTTPVNFSTQLI